MSTNLTVCLSLKFNLLTSGLPYWNWFNRKCPDIKSVTWFIWSCQSEWHYWAQTEHKLTWLVEIIRKLLNEFPLRFHEVAEPWRPTITHNNQLCTCIFLIIIKPLLHQMQGKVTTLCAVTWKRYLLSFSKHLLKAHFNPLKLGRITKSLK